MPFYVNGRCNERHRSTIPLEPCGGGGRYRMTYRKTYSEHMSASRASSPHGPSLQDSVIIPLLGKRIP